MPFWWVACILGLGRILSEATPRCACLLNADLPMLYRLQQLFGLDFPIYPLDRNSGYVLTSRIHHPLLTIFLPFPCSCSVFGIIELYYAGIPSGNFLVGLAAHIGVTYISISVGLNVALSAMISIRIADLGLADPFTRNTVRGVEKMRYAGTIPIIAESALPYALAGIACVVSYGLQSGISSFFLSIWVMFTVSFTLVSFFWVISLLFCDA